MYDVDLSNHWSSFTSHPVCGVRCTVNDRNRNVTPVNFSKRKIKQVSLIVNVRANRSCSSNEDPFKLVARYLLESSLA